MKMEDIFKLEPYLLSKSEKEKLFNSFLANLSKHHYAHCKPYQKMMDSMGFDVTKKLDYTKLPFLPVQLFKTEELISVPKNDFLKTILSSGTSEQRKSQVYLDKENANNQTRALTKILSSFIGDKRMPMIIIDSESTLNNRSQLSARAAGVLGFSILGSKRLYALTETKALNVELLQTFLKKHQGQRIFLFGFTFMIFHYFYKALLKLEVKLDFSNVVLIHGGGWKKLAQEAISKTDFKTKLHNVCGISSVYDYYGMAEQTGSIYMECEYGNYHASIFSDIIIRRALDFSVADIGEEGIIQVLSLLPKSYPGHSLLTEDKGVLLGEDNCPCCRKGKYFKIIGRLTNVELRGCSDTYD